jgi:hypothetical protein
MNPICPYCNKESKKVSGKKIYPYLPKLWHKTYYECSPCGTYVGCHPGTERPLGVPANKDLRTIRIRAHSVFDTLWQSGKMKRGQAYCWLERELKLEPGDCHIGLFSFDQCVKAIELCTRKAL